MNNFIAYTFSEVQSFQSFCEVFDSGKSHSVQLNGNNFIVCFLPYNFFITNAIASWTLGGISIKMNLKITSLCEWLLQTADLNFVVSNLYWRQLYSLVLLTTFSNKWSKNGCLCVSSLLYCVKQIVSQLKDYNCSFWGFLMCLNKLGTIVLKFVVYIYRLWLNKNKKSSVYLAINHCLFM